MSQENISKTEVLLEAFSEEIVKTDEIDPLIPKLN